MSKFTKFEGSVILQCLTNGLVADLETIQKAEEAGKNPLFTKEYIQTVYKELMERVEGMTKKK